MAACLSVCTFFQIDAKSQTLIASAKTEPKALMQNVSICEAHVPDFLHIASLMGDRPKGISP